MTPQQQARMLAWGLGCGVRAGGALARAFAVADGLTSDRLMAPKVAPDAPAAPFHSAPDSEQ